MNLLAFTKEMFGIVNPGVTFQPNWHIEAVAEYLQEVTESRVKRLLINMPPRYMKSFLVSVAWPAWLLGNDPSRRIIAASYSTLLSEKHGYDCRAVMQDKKYTEIFPKTEISADHNTRRKFITTKHGFRLSTSTEGTLLGDGGNFLILDDPHQPADFLSGAKKVVRTKEWFKSVFLNRLDDKKKGVIVVVMQRIDPHDISADILELTQRWQHLVLPVQARTTMHISIGNFAHTYQAGEYLHPEREGEEEILALKEELSARVFEGMYMQSPASCVTPYITPEDIVYYPADGLEERKDLEIIHSWDVAFTGHTKSDYNAYTVWGCDRALHHYYLLYVIRKQATFEDMKCYITHAIKHYPPDTVLVEVGDGKHCLMETCKEHAFAECNVYTVESRGKSKELRFQNILSCFRQKRVYLPEKNEKNASWISDYKAELLLFPGGRYDDQIDATSQCLIWLSKENPDDYLRYKLVNSKKTRVRAGIVEIRGVTYCRDE